MSTRIAIIAAGLVALSGCDEDCWRLRDEGQPGARYRLVHWRAGGTDSFVEFATLDEAFAFAKQHRVAICHLAESP